MKATTRIVLPHFQESGKPFVMLFWSRDPDISQHEPGTASASMMPGINGPSGKAGTRNADTMLGELLAALKEQGSTRPPMCSSPPITASPPSAMPAPPALRRTSIPMRRWRTCSPASWPSIWRRRWACRCVDPAIPARRVDFSNGGKLAGGSGMLGSDPAIPMWSWRPMAAPT